VISVADLRTALKLEPLDDAYAEEEEAAYLEDLEEAAVAFVERYTGRYYGPEVEDSEHVVGGSASGTLFLPERMSVITSVASRSYLGGTETEIGEEDADGWLLKIGPGATHGFQLIRRGGGWWDAGLEYVVIGTIGYAAGTEPPDIRKAVIKIVGRWNEQRVQVGDAPSAEIPADVKEILKLHRRLVI
jgi:hypothetical protein